MEGAECNLLLRGAFILTAAKPDGKEAHIFRARTTDGVRNFSFQGFMMKETEGYAIMPSSVRLTNGR